MPITSPDLYLQTPVHRQDCANLARHQFWQFAGVDLAPNETLETGLVTMNRNRELLRVDKLYSNDSVKQALESLGPPQNTLVILDMPKNLEIPGKFRHEEIKWHAFRLERDYLRAKKTDRFSPRARDLYDELTELGYSCLLSFSYNAKVAFGLHIPYKSRSPHGCRALQSKIKEELKLDNMPVNLAPSSVLDAMVGAYSAWLVYSGLEGVNYRLFLGPEERIYIQPLKPIS